MDAPKGPMLGGHTPVDLDNSNSLEYDELGKFAVEEHNSKQNSVESTLKFSKVVSAETQVVSGAMHHLVLEAETQAGEVKQYTAKIWEKTWESFKQLMAFDPKEA